MTHLHENIIIGWWAAGLYLASQFEKAGKEYILLEARDRLGGRVHGHIDAHGHILEYGPEFLHEQQSTWSKMVAATGTPLREFDRDNILSVTYTGQRHLLDAFLQHYDLPHYHAVREKAWENPDENSLLDAINAAVPAQFRYLYSGAISSYYGHDLDRVPADRWEIHEDGINDANMTMPETLYHTLLTQTLAPHKNRIYFERHVQSIDYSDSHVTIRTPQEIYHAKRIFITVPLGVLKAKQIAFHPTLPVKKQQAIDNIGFDSIIKTQIVFTKRLWRDGPRWLLADGLIPLYFSTKPFILTGYLVGEKAKQLGWLSNDEIYAALYKDLCYNFGQSDVAHYVTDITRKDWWHDMFAMGGYSCDTLASAWMRKDLIAPIDGKVFFLGEACVEDGSVGCVHGAIRSVENMIARGGIL
jgi:monoamine oxidase